MTYIRIRLSLPWFIIAVIVLVLIIATAFLLGMFIVRRYRDREICRLKVQVEQTEKERDYYQTKRREAVNACADLNAGHKI